MNLFDFDSNGVNISSRFWLYWAISLPLTILTLGIWAIWVNRVYLNPKLFLARMRMRKEVEKVPRFVHQSQSSFSEQAN